MVDQINNDDDFLDFPVVEEIDNNNNNNNDGDDSFIAKGLTLNQALQEDNILLANEILLDIIDSIDNEKEHD